MKNVTSYSAPDLVFGFQTLSTTLRKKYNFNSKAKTQCLHILQFPSSQMPGLPSSLLPKNSPGFCLCRCLELPPQLDAWDLCRHFNVVEICIQNIHAYIIAIVIIINQVCSQLTFRLLAFWYL